MAASGPLRGENIYFYKCWMCHNKYAKGGPYLKDLFQQENLVNGEPVSEESVTQFIKEGAAGMPSFKTTLFRLRSRRRRLLHQARQVLRRR